jgi:hypothetical protein
VTNNEGKNYSDVKLESLCKNVNEIENSTIVSSKLNINSSSCSFIFFPSS